MTSDATVLAKKSDNAPPRRRGRSAHKGFGSLFSGSLFSVLTAETPRPQRAQRFLFFVLWFFVLSKVMQRFGEKLRTLRKQRGMTQHELAAQLGFASQGYIHFLETGKKLPNAQLILKIADFFEVTTDQLMRDELEVA